MVAEAPAAVAVSDAQQGLFRPGMMPAVGAYADNGRLALGVRLRAGVLRNGPSPTNNLQDPGFGGLGTAGMAVRIRIWDGWTELVGGGGLTGRDLVPTLEAGVGWTFAARSFDAGPSVRYVRVQSRDPMAALGTAELVLVGIDIQFGKHHGALQSPHVPTSPPREQPVLAAPAVLEAERDADPIRDVEESCETTTDGCPVADQIVVHADRIVLDERVVFDFGQARVRSAGRDRIAQIAKAWRAHPEWLRITIEGHSDVRGTDEYNQYLSQLRADRARIVLLKHGFPPESVEAIGYGRSKPRDLGTTEAAYARNRRVEFVIDRGGLP